MNPFQSNDPAALRIGFIGAGRLGCALAWSGTLDAQAIQRAMYVSALTEAGAPLPDLGPSDFVVREDNLAREVLKVEPAVDPMQIAILVDTSQGARDARPQRSSRYSGRAA